ncbi:hypothetical protein LTR53_004553 [Teratosphaeriaceae sp. CCFEE 6253]|nr:hypothetical protein LTR53_004553 [Teratosphaeriaceae sp. CCFEE 6253]
MTFLQRIVKNDSMKNDPPEIYGWRAFVLALSACFGGMLFGFDIGTIGGVLTLPEFMKEYGLDHMSKAAKADLSANIASTLQAGCFFGALIASYIADKLGRRTGLMIAASVTIVGVVMQSAASGSIPCMYVGRLVAGFGVGAASMIVPLYISESAPRAIRGGLTGIYQLYIATGTMLAFWVNYGSIQHLSGKASYIVPLVMQALPALCLICFIACCNESPRFLAKQDRWEAAEKVLTTVRQLPRDHPYIRAEISDIHQQLEHERMLIGLMICQQMTGTNAINYYAPTIFKNLGIQGTSTGLFATGIYGIVKMTTCACFLLFAADSLGRRKSLLWTSIAQGCAMFYVGLYVRIDPPVTGAAVPPAGYMALVCIFLFAGFFQFGWGPVCWIYVSEIPTARLRSMNVAIAAATQWLFNFVVARATLTMFVTCGRGGYGTFLIYGSFCFSMFFFVWFFIPETKGKSLEQMDDLFGVTELAKQVEAERAHSIDAGRKDPATITEVEKTAHPASPGSLSSSPIMAVTHRGSFPNLSSMLRPSGSLYDDCVWRWLPRLAEIVNSLRCSPELAAYQLINLDNGSGGLAGLVPEPGKKYLAGIYNTLLQRICRPNTSDIHIAGFLRASLDNKLDRDEQAEWAGLDAGPHWTFKLFSTLCFVSRQVRSRCLGDVLHRFAMDNIDILMADDSEDSMRWVRCIQYSGMRQAKKADCLSMLADADPRLTNYLGDRSARGRDHLDDLWDNGNRDLYPGGKRSLGSWCDWELDNRFDRPLRDRYRERRSVSSLGDRRSGRLEVQVQNVLVAADNLQEESRALARIARQ